jgi:uncharacterized damage-inducible protein DinB
VRARFDGLEASRRALLESLAGLPDEAVRRPPAAGVWSIVQVVGHLTLAEEATLAYLRKKMQASPSALSPAGPMSWVRMVAVAALLRSPLRRKAPSATADPPAAVGLSEARARWDRVRAEWAAFLDAFPPEMLGRAVFRHPFAGRMSIAHTLGFMQEHQRHHARQIARLRAGLPGAGRAV